MRLSCQKSLLHEVLINNAGRTTQDEKRNILINFLIGDWCLVHDEHITMLKLLLSRNFFSKYFDKWDKACRCNQRFLANNEGWLAEFFVFEIPENPVVDNNNKGYIFECTKSRGEIMSIFQK